MAACNHESRNGDVLEFVLYIKLGRLLDKGLKASGSESPQITLHHRSLVRGLPFPETAWYWCVRQRGYPSPHVV
jgi:hypothetical protein